MPAIGVGVGIGFILYPGPGPTTHFVVTVPLTAEADSAFNFTVTAKDANGVTAYGYTGTVTFSSSDIFATLPSNSTLINGVRVFSATLQSDGLQAITATDTVTGSIHGTGTLTIGAESWIWGVTPMTWGETAAFWGIP